MMSPARIFFYALSALSIALPVAVAQGAPYAQCGGNGWTGAITCVSGYTCTFSSQWYSQCVPGSPTPSSSSSSTATSNVPTPTSTSTVKPNYWFSFGDSYTQTGFDPAGTLPSIGNPFGNPPYPGWTSANGPNWVGLASTVYNHSTVLLYNYAYGGATIDATLVTPYTPSVLSLTDQVNQFLTGAGTGSKVWTSANALFSIWIGVNDIGNSWYMSGDRAAFSDTLIAAQFALVQKLYNAGARNFLFLNVPPVDRSPLMLAQSAESQATEKAVINTHNAKLAARIAAFKSANSGVQTFLWDSAATFKKILDSPSTYGFVDATSYGGAKSFWLDNLHPITAAHAIFAKEIGELLGSTVW